MARSGKAAICRELNKPVVVEEISVEGPRRGEALVKIAACGVCHSDLSATGLLSSRHTTALAFRVMRVSIIVSLP